MENMPLAINLVFVGLTVVFSALIILSLIIYLSTKILAGKKKEEAAGNVVTDEASILEIEEDDTDANSAISDSIKSDDELAAVIMAAIQASMLPGSQCKLKVKSFRRIAQTSPAWNKTGRIEQIANRL